VPYDPVVTEMLSRRLQDISPKAYEHPADRAATAALQSIPGLDPAIRALVEMRYERAYRQSFMASAMRIGPEQLPRVWSLWQAAIDTLDLADSFDVYVRQSPVVNASAIGASKPMVVVNSASITLLDDQELQTILAHEAGHILSDHTLYQTALVTVLQLSPLVRLPLLGGLPMLAIRSILLEWYRAAELSADRAATLVNRDPLVTSRTLLVLASGLPSAELNLDAFLRQGQEYREWDSAWDRLSRRVTELNLTHSYPVGRVAELTEWVRSGEYDRIVAGSYRKRGEKVDAAVEADAAFQHYRDRFQRIIAETSETLAKVPDRMADWLRKTGAAARGTES
jgi:Zn-dependent protease with chaperone function